MSKCPNGKDECDCTPDELRMAANRKPLKKERPPPKLFIHISHSLPHYY